MKTRNDIYYDLSESPFRKTSSDKMILHFSSKMHLTKFTINQFLHRLKVKRFLLNKYGFNVCYDLLADLCLYVKIETRGFYIQLTDGGTILCQADVVLYGEKITDCSLNQRLTISTGK